MDREKKSTMSTGRISNEHHYACKEIVAERDALRSQVSALQAEVEGLRRIVPDKIKPATRTLESMGYANGWNDCIDSLSGGDS